MRMSLLDLKHLKQVKDKEHKSTLPYKQHENMQGTRHVK